MLTAIAVLLLSAVGGGIIGSLLTTTYPADSICHDCEDKAQYQEQVMYERTVQEYPQEEYPSNRDGYENYSDEEYNYNIGGGDTNNYQNSEESQPFDSYQY